MHSATARPLRSPLTLVVCKNQRVLNGKGLTWVFDNAPQALFAAMQFEREPWFLLRGEFLDFSEAVDAIGRGGLLVAHSSNVPACMPLSGPFLRKCQAEGDWPQAAVGSGKGRRQKQGA